MMKPLWELPWSYAESFVIGLGLMITGFLLEISFQHQAFLWVFPYNVIALGFFIILLYVLYKFFPNYPLIKSLQRVPASISSIVLLGLMIMVMGIVPQEASENVLINSLGLNHITTHWAFLLLLLYFLCCLGMVTLKRLHQFRWKDTGFVLNHIGLFMALVSGMMGAGDLQRVKVYLTENQPTLRAETLSGEWIELPFVIYLKDFKLDEYPPKLALIDNKTGKVIHNNGKNLFLIQPHKTYSFGNYTVRILTYFPTAGKVSVDKYAPVNQEGAAPAALIQISDNQHKIIKTGWVSSGSFLQDFEGLKINDEYSMVMTIPEPKKFSSFIDILTLEKERIPAELSVNQPFRYKGWEIYQLSYDEKKGRWSDTAVIEMVRDPWLPFVYIGIFMMIFGAIWMLWKGKKV